MKRRRFLQAILAAPVAAVAASVPLPVPESAPAPKSSTAASEAWTSEELERMAEYDALLAQGIDPPYHFPPPPDYPEPSQALAAFLDEYDRELIDPNGLPVTKADIGSGRITIDYDAEYARILGEQPSEGIPFPLRCYGPGVGRFVLPDDGDIVPETVAIERGMPYRHPCSSLDVSPIIFEDWSGADAPEQDQRDIRSFWDLERS